MAAHTIRILAEAKNNSPSVADAATLKAPFWWRGNDLRVELALADNGKFLTSADVGTITVLVKNITDGPNDPALMLKTIAAADCDATFTAGDWRARTGQLCVATWTRAEAALGAGNYQLIVTHDDGAGSRNTHLSTLVTVKEDKHDSISLSAPPPPPAEYYTEAESDGRFLSFGKNQTLTPSQKAQLEANWPEAVGNAVVVTGAFADGASHPLSDTYGSLAAAQVDFPAATALTDEQDWAAIQSALDTLNLVAGEESGGTVYLPPGDYVVNKTLYLRGPGVTLCGAGSRESWVSCTHATGYAIQLTPPKNVLMAAITSRQYPTRPMVRDITFANYDEAATSLVGFNTFTPGGSKGWWKILYVSLIRADFVGFDVSVELSNTAIGKLEDCNITGRTCSLRMWSPDSVVMINCDPNGTFVTRDGSQTEYVTNTNIEILNVDANDMTGDEVNTNGGGGLGFMMLGGELGHGFRAVYVEGCRSYFAPQNMEDTRASSAIKMVGPSYIHWARTRFDLSTGNDSTARRELFHLDCNNDWTSTPTLRLTDLRFPPLETPVVRVSGPKYYQASVKSEYPIEIAYQPADLPNEESVPAPTSSMVAEGRITPWSLTRSVWSDSSAGNEQFAGQSMWVTASSTYGQDFLRFYQTNNGDYLRSSTLNSRLIEILGEETSDIASDGTADQRLATIPTRPNIVVDDGQKIKVEAWGTFAANGNSKTIELILSDFSGVDTILSHTGSHNELSWSLSVILMKDGNNFKSRATLLIDGVLPIVKNATLANSMNGNREIRFEATTTTASDLILEGFTAQYEKGKSNN